MYYISGKRLHRNTWSETHHIHKLDAPSGTAITLAEGILENIDRKDKWVEGTFTAPDGTISGTTDCAPDELPISSIREGEVFGIHTVRYESDIDSISITHDAKNRGGFVLGAILAAEFTAHHEGFLGMAVINKNLRHIRIFLEGKIFPEKRSLV